MTILTKPSQTTKATFDEAVEYPLNAPDRQAEDLVLPYFACHGDVEHIKNMFCLLVFGYYGTITMGHLSKKR